MTDFLKLLQRLNGFLLHGPNSCDFLNNTLTGLLELGATRLIGLPFKSLSKGEHSQVFHVKDYAVDNFVTMDEIKVFARSRNKEL